MKTIEISAHSADTEEHSRAQSDLLGALAKGWRALAQRTEDRRTLHRLYQLDAHVLRDMGFDPDAIYRAHESAIGDMSALRRHDF